MLNDAGRRREVPDGWRRAHAWGDGTRGKAERWRQEVQGDPAKDGGMAMYLIVRF